MNPAPLPAPRTLTSSQIAQWHDLGYVAVPDFFSPSQVRALQAEVRRLQDDGKLRNVATTGDGVTTSTTAFNLQICPAAPVSRLIRSLPYDPRVVNAVQALLGDPVLLYLDQIFLKPAHHGAGTGWHTDNAYFKSPVVTQGTGMWIAIHDANRANGTMRVVPRSHLMGLDGRHVRDPGSDHHITCAHLVDEAQAVNIELPAGGVLFFNYGIAHATGGNQTAKDRAALAYHFMRADADNPYNRTAYDNTRLHLTGQWADGGAAYWKEDLTSAFAQEVAAHG
jgi:phytanoyl-CoA hydroxylase